MRVSTYRHAKRFAKQPLERLRVAARGPELELRVAAGSNLQQAVLAAIVKVDIGDRLGVTAIEALGQPENRRQRPNRAAALARQLAEARVPLLRGRTTMIPRQERDCLDLVGLEAA